MDPVRFFKSTRRHGDIIVDVTVLGLVGGAPAHLGWGGDTARRRFIGGGRGPLLS